MAAEERMKAINDAYDVLSNPTKKANYDQKRARQTRTESTAASHSTAATGQAANCALK
jgi:curved DNA-binding protein CbpA